MILDLRKFIRTPMQRALYRVFGPLLETLLGLRGTNDIYQKSREQYGRSPEGPTCHAWFDAVVKSMKVTVEIDEAPDFEFPKSGPLIIVANHPFGILDPCVLAQYVSARRPELKVMTNSMLGVMPELLPHIIAVNPFGGQDAARKNVGAMKEAIRHLRAGGALAIFPAGEVSAYQLGKRIEESPWSNHIGSLIQRTQANVLPIFFPGTNSTLFHAAGMIHPRLRTGLMFREFCNRAGHRVEMRVGMPITHAKLRKFDDDVALTKYLRIHTLVLAKRRKSPAAAVAGPDIATTTNAATDNLYERILHEVDALHERGACIVSQSGLSVYCAQANEIPETLQEIGRLREITFREEGEGTGHDIDLDKFDNYYLHLFLWDEEKQRIAGAYRLGRADVILRDHGPKGLYTNTLFKFETPFLEHLDDAVEMGRSFITKEYQRNISSLLLLWKGIARWMARNPSYKKLFGPVSISKDYNSLSRRIMVEFLRKNCLHRNLASFVKPRNPFRYLRSRHMMREFISADLRDVDDCSALISSVETDRKGIPILLKHYLRLSGTILSFNVDKGFSSVIDGLIMVNLTETEPKLLAKYMGEENCRVYLTSHGVVLPPEKSPAGTGP